MHERRPYGASASSRACLPDPESVFSGGTEICRDGRSPGARSPQTVNGSLCLSWIATAKIEGRCNEPAEPHRLLRVSRVDLMFLLGYAKTAGT